MKKVLLISLIIVKLNVQAQQAFPVSDSLPVTSEGLRAGYNITGTSEKEVGDKGNFSRYKIQFYITNTSSEAKIMLRKQGFFTVGSGISANIATFKCLNATGARLTSKEVFIEAKPCIVDALVDERDASNGKTVQERKPANIGYWLKPGETVSNNAIVIVPLNQKPDVTVIFFPASTGTIGSAINNDNNNYNNNNTYNNNIYTNNNTSQPSPQGFVRIKNFASNNYLHNQNGPVTCTTINFDWWSAQWEFVPVNGTNNFQIRNRWKKNFISTENNNFISDNGQSAKAMWTIEETGVANVYYIKNVSDNSKLTYQNGSLKTSNSFFTSSNAQWVIEQ